MFRCREIEVVITKFASMWNQAVKRRHGTLCEVHQELESISGILKWILDLAVCAV